MRELVKNVKEIIRNLIKFRDVRDWKQFHTPDNLAKSISIESNELLENFQWGNQNADMDNIKEEVADIFGYLLLFCKELNIDLIDVTNTKIKVNNDKYPVEKAFGTSKKYIT